MEKKKKLKQCAKVFGFSLLLPGPILFMYGLLTIILPYFIFGLMLLIPFVSLPGDFPNLPQPFSFCYARNTTYYIGLVEFMGYLFLIYGLIDTSKSKKSEKIVSLIALTALFCIVLFFTLLGLFLDCWRF